MNVLVTGATGFIGSHLARRLHDRGDRVVCLAKDAMYTPFLESAGMEVMLADLNNGVDWPRALRTVDVVYHLAGLTRARRWAEYYEANQRATARFIRACAAHGRSLKRFVYVSSQTAAGPSRDGAPLTEEMPCRPVSHYGRSKLLAEEAVREWKGDIPVTIVRPSAVYGPRERDWYEYFKMVRKGIQPVIGLGTKYLSLIHAEDLVDGIIRAADAPGAAGQTYFLAGEEPHTTVEIGNAMAAAAAKRTLKVRLPHAVVYGAGAVMETIARVSGRQVFFNLQKVRESVCRAWVCSVEKAARELGFRTKVGLEGGMEETYRWYQANGWFR